MMTSRCSRGSVSSAMRRSRKDSRALPSSAASGARTSSTGTGRRLRMWSMAALCATRSTQAENGTLRGW